MKKSYVIGGIAILVIAFGAVVYWYGSQTPAPAAPTPAPSQNTTPPTSSNPPAPTPPPTPAPAPAAPQPQSFDVTGNDTSGSPLAITVPKGTQVTITFHADAQGTYHGGLDFRSSVVSTGTIMPGGSKTVTFAAMQSFAFTPYWPATQIAKPYKIQITVQ